MNAAVANRRAADRRLLIAKIDHDPSPARFRSKTLNVLFHDPAKARDIRSAGFVSNWTGDIYIALPLTDRTPPESEKETIDVQDWSDQTHTYIVGTVTPLRGDNCYKLSLRARNTRPARGAAVSGL